MRCALEEDRVEVRVKLLSVRRFQEAEDFKSEWKHVLRVYITKSIGSLLP